MFSAPLSDGRFNNERRLTAVKLPILLASILPLIVVLALAGPAAPMPDQDERRIIYRDTFDLNNHTKDCIFEIGEFEGEHYDANEGEWLKHHDLTVFNAQGFRLHLDTAAFLSAMLVAPRDCPYCLTGSYWFEDINFDGYADLFFSERCTSRNCLGWAWLYNPRSRRYEFVETFADDFASADMQVHPESQTISFHYWGGTSGAYSYSIYTFRDGEFELVQQYGNEGMVVTKETTDDFARINDTSVVIRRLVKDYEAFGDEEDLERHWYAGGDSCYYVRSLYERGRHDTLELIERDTLIDPSCR